MLRQSFVEGAYRLYCKAVDDGVIRNGDGGRRAGEDHADPERVDGCAETTIPASPRDVADRIRGLVPTDPVMPDGLREKLTMDQFC